MALVCLCRGNFYWPPHTTILFCSIFLDKIVLDTLKSRYHRSAPLGIAFFVKLGGAYFDYRQRGQFEWVGPAILFACLIFSLVAPKYIWNIIGI